MGGSQKAIWKRVKHRRKRQNGKCLKKRECTFGCCLIFPSKSEYTIQGKVEKSVTIFLAITEDKNTVIQQEEIEDFIWLRYDRALKMLNYENDKMILTKANRFLMETAMPKI